MNPAPPETISEAIPDAGRTMRSNADSGIGDLAPCLPAGPTPVSAELESSRRLCRSISKSQYENFLVASVLLPRRMRQPFFDVYAFCRTADDLADESDSKAEAIQGLAEYRDQVRKVFEGEAVAGIFVALSDTVARFKLPRQPLDDLLDAFEQDQKTERYDNEPQLLDYCKRSANPVGRLVLAMADCRDEESIRLSDQICTALQLTNFWQDVARDFQIGRIYLPKSVMDRHGFTEDVIGQTIHDQAPTPIVVRQAIAELCEQTRERFQEGRCLTGRVPNWLAADVELFVQGGLATLDAIQRSEFDVLRRRVKVSKIQQAWLTFRVLITRRFTQSQVNRKSLP